MDNRDASRREAETWRQVRCDLSLPRIINHPLNSRISLWPSSSVTQQPRNLRRETFCKELKDSSLCASRPSAHLIGSRTDATLLVNRRPHEWEKLHTNRDNHGRNEEDQFVNDWTILITASKWTLKYDRTVRLWPLQRGVIFGELKYCLRISVGIFSIAVFTLASLVDTGTGSNLVKKHFLPPAWWESTKLIESPVFCTVSRNVDFVGEFVPIFIFTDGLRLRACLD